MEQVKPPESFTKELSSSQILTIGPPPGVSREHCIDAQVCITNDWLDDGMGLAFVMFFKPTDEEWEQLKNPNSMLKLTIRGSSLVPHSLGTWTDE